MNYDSMTKKIHNDWKPFFEESRPKLEEIIKKEDKMHKAGIDISKFIDPYMVVIEYLILLHRQQ